MVDKEDGDKMADFVKVKRWISRMGIRKQTLSRWRGGKVGWG